MVTQSIIRQGDEGWQQMFDGWDLEGRPVNYRKNNIEYLVAWDVGPDIPKFVPNMTYGTSSDHKIDPYYNDTSN